MVLAVGAGGVPSDVLLLGDLGGEVEGVLPIELGIFRGGRGISKALLEVMRSQKRFRPTKTGCQCSLQHCSISVQQLWNSCGLTNSLWWPGESILFTPHPIRNLEILCHRNLPISSNCGESIYNDQSFLFRITILPIFFNFDLLPLLRSDLNCRIVCSAH